MPRPKTDIVAVGAGGALGAAARYELSRFITVGRGGFPWATFWINLSGCLLLGVVVTVLLRRAPQRRTLRTFMTTGVIGAYTTFSTFVVEADLLVKNGHALTALGYAVASIAAGIAVLTTGARAANR